MFRTSLDGVNASRNLCPGRESCSRTGRISRDLLISHLLAVKAALELEDGGRGKE